MRKKHLDLPWLACVQVVKSEDAAESPDEEAETVGFFCVGLQL